MKMIFREIKFYSNLTDETTLNFLDFQARVLDEELMVISFF